MDNAWGKEPFEWKHSSECVAECPTCDGRKYVSCADCNGLGTTACQACSSTGRVPGRRGTKQCPRCQGRGERKCSACQRGRTKCGKCDGTSRVYAWLDVHEDDRFEVTTTADDFVRRHHHNLLEPSDADAQAWNARRIEDSTLPEATLHPQRLRPSLERGERVISARRQAFELETHDVSIRLGTGCAVVTTVGNWGSIDRSSKIGSLRLRRALAGLTAFTLGAAAMVAVGYRLSQHRWFLEHGENGALIGITSLASVIALATVLEGTLCQAARRLWLVWAGIVALFASTIAFVTHYNVAPSLAKARMSLAHREIERARLEADALIATEESVSEAATLLDDAALLELNSATNLDDMSRAGNRDWHVPDNRLQAANTIARTAISQIQRAAANRIPIRAASIRTATAWLPSSAHAELETELAVGELLECALAAPVDCLEPSVERTRQVNAPKTRTAPALQRAGENLQASIAERLAALPKLNTRAVRDQLVDIVRASQVMHSAAGQASTPPLRQLESRLVIAERNLKAEEAETARRTRQAEQRAAQAEATRLRRLKAESAARRTTSAIKQLIIQESIDAYPGPCACPYNAARNGSSCGGRSAYSRAGGYSPLCYASDVSASMVEEYRARNP
jgi:hypothetical protein